ncbi:glycosyltransferase involved in cell wall biosynthesis [Marinoscillum furvescens DSM 4134]|uniref:Glycosyltransferase involved in cell wall biosynthesis n=1 Tax=Marinoscillum furvescens DSM 4134 TaxID=1122208 RepID=A0A3D9L5Y4_MARFU|nr:glycosyltransferase involved in cell wall biosynthesis [Marinoscillum furvescens DSM 4134]
MEEEKRINQQIDIRVIIPAFNEQNAVGLVVEEIPKSWVSEVIVVDNGSQDDTYEQAKSKGATAIKEPQKGYGQACLKGMHHIASSPGHPDIVVFLDGDHSDYPEQLPDLVKPIIEGQADMVIGSRALGQKEKGSMTPQQVFGNWLATSLIKWLYGHHYTDLGPFRAIKYSTLLALQMQDTNYGWTVEMQLKAAKQKFKTLDVPVNYRKRIGVSKVSGTLKGTIMAGYKILFTIFRYL